MTASLAIVAVAACEPSNDTGDERGGGAAPGPCAEAPERILQRVKRGYFPKRSGDVLAVERPPNQFGTRHSTPWPYTQDVPLLLYGPGYIMPGTSSDRSVTVADLAPTFAELLDFDDFGEREGRVLDDALLPVGERNGLPRLLVTVVWDGGGVNMLEQWPDAWPNLKQLMEASAVYENATAGSTPSITPSIHATIGTGDFPRTHGLPDTRMRVKGQMVDAWENKSPRFLKVETLGDMWDRANGNLPKVGLVARDAWHLGMLGHGSYSEGGDKDIAVLDALGRVEFTGNEKFYELPEYATSLEGLEEAIDEVDARDGEADGLWLGNPINSLDGRVRETPAWSIFQTQKIMELLRNEGFGRDEVPDLFYTNYKSTDLAGHSYNMVEPEVRDDLKEQDRQLALLIEGLDDLVGKNRYVLALTADHGVTPYPEVTGGWSIETADITNDITEAFDRDGDETPLVLANRGYQVFLNESELEDNGVTSADVAAFVRNYRIRDNVTPTNKVLERFESRVDERLFLTAMSHKELESAACAGS